MNSTLTNVFETKHEIPPAKLSKRNWKRLPKDLRRYSRRSVEQYLGIMEFHEGLHVTNTPHWIERRQDGVYLLWGDDAANSAIMHGVSMDEMSIGTRIAG